MTLRSMHEGVIGKVTKYIILGLLGTAVVSMALMDGGSFFRNNVNSSDIARIENKRVSIQNFDGIFRRQISQYGISPQQAYEDGTLRGILANEIRANFVEIESEKMGVVVNKDYLQKRIAEMVAPHVKKDQSLQQALDTILRSQQMDENTFIKGVTREIATDLITEAVKSGFPTIQESLAKDLLLFQTQTRDIQFITLKNASVKNASKPTEQQIKDIYEKQKNDLYSTPEIRSIKIALLDSESLVAKSQISDEELQKFYDENKDSFITPKQTILTQTIIKNKDDAKKIMELINQGENFKDAVSKTVKDKTDFFEKIPFDESTMIPQIAQALEGKENGAIVGPIETQLGSHIVQLDGYTEERAQEFSEVKETIRQEITNAKILDDIYAASQKYDEMVADGMKYNAITKTLPLKFTEIAEITRYGETIKGEDALASLPENLQPDRMAIIESAFETQNEEISKVVELPSGNFATIQTLSIKEKTPKPFDEVKTEIEKNLINESQKNANQERVATYIKDIKDKKITFNQVAQKENVKVENQTKIGLTTELKAPLTQLQLPTIFKTPIGGVESFHTDDGIVLLNISKNDLPDLSTPENQSQLTALKKPLDDEIKGEAFAMYLEMLSKRYVAVINEPLLKRAYAPKETEGQ